MGMFAKKSAPAPVMPRSVVDAFDPNKGAMVSIRKKQGALTSLLGTQDTGDLAQPSLLGG